MMVGFSVLFWADAAWSGMRFPPRAQYRTGREGGPRSFRRRTMPPPGHIPETVAPGWALTITSADFGGLGAVTETPPAGFGCASSDLDDGEVQATGQQVRFTLQGDSPPVHR